ncbi:MAG: ArsR family transcriptional regulator [Deltaproteobacteria bacterium]|jgi:DNA-binding MarR family transcriptional regulator|nr:ArsR family transcriptional regulator [Deltaproteobacteria bacterium]MBT4638770.1 ArsR family transcriptional regulator [Deltaproteobacteria bacterium]MBT6500581.1 ArsR family transcriptional regulator [Deltaproteobacteria bacterium]MBT6613328.1 ArsR family transcriptional regulator [Deltaproteobacteria bacterium]MBT7152315.1 ArsR family transcriptional regulator [Deltaproteobacteria bacterium]
MAELNKIIHERARLLILTYLARNEEKEVSFSDLKNELQISSGNLSVQLNKLKDAHLIGIDKSFKDNRPLTLIAITPEGLDALNAYFDEMEKMIRSLRK